MNQKYLVPIALSLCVAGSAFASSVSFTTSLIDPNDPGTFLNNNGSVMAAVNFGVSRSAPYTYNAPTASSNPDPNVTLNGITFTPTAGVINPSGLYYSIAAVGGGGPTTGYDTGRFSTVSYQNTALYGLVYDVLRTGGNDQRLTLSLNNLVIGQDYQLQMIFSELNNADQPSNNPADRNVQVSAGAFTQGSDTQHGTGADGDTAFLAYGGTSGARLITASFTADSTSELFSLLSGTTGGFSRVSLAGFVLSNITPVPEPSTYALLAFGGAAVVFFARRKKTA